MHAKHDEFIAAIHAKKKLRVVFYSEEDGANLRTNGSRRRSEDQRWDTQVLDLGLRQ